METEWSKSEAAYSYVPRMGQSPKTHPTIPKMQLNSVFPLIIHVII